MSGRHVTLENDRIALTVAPAFGARVTRLTDKRNGRDWVVPGPLAGDRGNEAVYLGDQARGWDECYPTVGRCPAPDWGRPLRDHGDLWGRPWQSEADRGRVTTVYRDAQTRFRRTLSLDGDTVVAAYEVINESAVRLPIVWSQHCLIACRPGERLTIEGVDRIEAGGKPIDLTDVAGTDMTTIQDQSAGVALKAYGRLITDARISVVGPAGGIAFAWSATDAAHAGFWLDYGGWPEGAPTHQVAIEPTTSPTDDLAGALARGTAVWLAPGESRTWRVTITLMPPQHQETS